MDSYNKHWFKLLLGTNKNQPLALGIEYTVAQCADTPNFIFAIKQRGLGLTLEEQHSLLAQLA